MNAGWLDIPSDAACWDAGGLLLVADAPSQLTLAGWMLDLPVSPKMNDVDRRFLRDLADACARDFLETAAGLFSVGSAPRPIPPTRAQHTGVRFSLSVSSATKVLELHAPEHLALAARRGALPAPAPRSAPASRRDALERQSVRVGAMVGAGRVGLSDLANLSRGDVLVLDRGPGEDTALTINGEARPGTACVLEQQDAELTLRVNEFGSALQ